MKKDIPSNQERADTAVLLSYKVHLKLEKFTRGKEGHYICTKVSVYQDMSYIHASVNRAQNNEGKMEGTEGRNKSIIIIGNFITSFSIMDRTTRWKIKSKQRPMNTTINQVDLTNMTNLELSPECKGGSTYKTTRMMYILHALLVGMQNGV